MKAGWFIKCFERPYAGAGVRQAEVFLEIPELERHLEARERMATVLKERKGGWPQISDPQLAWLDPSPVEG